MYSTKFIALVGVVGFLMPACKSSDTTAAETSPITVAEPTQTASAAPQQPAPVKVDAAPITGSKPWLAAFSAKTVEGTFADVGAAHKACGAAELALCSETQWTAACAKDAEFADATAWTMSAEKGDGFVTRGGGSKCETRAVAKLDAKDAEHAAVCCERAIAIDSKNREQAFLDTASGKLMGWENALNARSADALKPLVDTSITFNGKRLTTAGFVDLATKFFEGDAAYWEVINTCMLTEQAAAKTWTAECKTIKHLEGKPTNVVERLVWGTATGKLQSITEIEVAGKPTSYGGGVGKPGLPQNIPQGVGRDAGCRRRCPGVPVEITHCYCVCMGLCSN